MKNNYEKLAVIKGSPEEVFSFMDDIENIGMHMTKSNAPMMGSKLTIEWLTQFKTGLGSKYRWKGNVMGMEMDFTVEVSRWIKDAEKKWGTTGNAKMIVLSWFEMYFYLQPFEDGRTQVILGINYTKSKGSILGFLLGRSYSKWCVNSMLRDTIKHFENN